jgi:hypothetical protein
MCGTGLGLTYSTFQNCGHSHKGRVTRQYESAELWYAKIPSGSHLAGFLSVRSSSPPRTRIQRLRPLLSGNDAYIDAYIKVKRMVCLLDRSGFEIGRNFCAAVRPGKVDMFSRKEVDLQGQKSEAP